MMGEIGDERVFVVGRVGSFRAPRIEGGNDGFADWMME